MPLTEQPPNFGKDEVAIQVSQVAETDRNFTRDDSLLELIEQVKQAELSKPARRHLRNRNRFGSFYANSPLFVQPGRPIVCFRAR